MESVADQTARQLSRRYIANGSKDKNATDYTDFTDLRSRSKDEFERKQDYSRLF
jgi:hypothetical protein